MTRIILKRNEDERILAGHPWVYDNEIDRVEGECSPGDVVDVESARKEYLGRGFINPASKIRVRIVSRGKDGIDAGFLKRRLREAIALRERTYDISRESFRLAFAEADFLPGLVVDVYAGKPAAGSVSLPVSAPAGSVSRDPDARPSGIPPAAPGVGRYVSLQTMSLGMDRFKDDIVRILVDLLDPVAIVERNDAPVRALEGLPEAKGVLYGTLPGEIIMQEHGISVLVDLLGGQKTGYFLDQRDNRAALEPYVKGLNVLDAFCHTGSFALHALKYGAASVTAVDISEAAVAMTERNAALNGVDPAKIETMAANVFDLLRTYERRKRKFGLVVLDPPAFTKNRAMVEAAYRGYKDINLRAISILEKGGFLVSCSCSHYFGPDRFLSMLKDAACDADRPLRILEQRFQAKDHPVLAGYDESLYLKCIIAQAM
jgi:23S rRNA (cytosine1962-C5)-methyltransferase